MPQNRVWIRQEARMLGTLQNVSALPPVQGADSVPLQEWGALRLAASRASSSAAACEGVLPAVGYRRAVRVLSRTQDSDITHRHKRHERWAKQKESKCKSQFGDHKRKAGKALQIMTGLFVHSLGLLWTYLLVTQIIAFQKVYIPVAVLSGFPFWAASFFLLSGIFTVLFEKKRSRSLMTYCIVLNILSVCSAGIGLLLLCLEFLVFGLAKKSIWPQRAGKILSDYLFLFTLLELCVTSTLISWLYKAKYSR